MTVTLVLLFDLLQLVQLIPEGVSLLLHRDSVLLNCFNPRGKIVIALAQPIELDLEPVARYLMHINLIDEFAHLPKVHLEEPYLRLKQRFVCLLVHHRVTCLIKLLNCLAQSLLHLPAHLLTD